METDKKSLEAQALEIIGLWAHDELCLGGPECEEREPLFAVEVKNLYQKLTDAGLLRTETMVEVESEVERWGGPYFIYGMKCGEQTLVYLAEDETHGDALYHAAELKRTRRNEFAQIVIEEYV